jgi:hypothetical protein
MPFRTKDFFVFLLTVAFLVVGITATVQSDIAKRSSDSSLSALVVSSEEVTYEAVLDDAVDMDRPSRLSSLRDKIASLVLDEPVEEVVVPDVVVEEEVVVPGAVLYCSRFSTTAPAWQATGLKFEVVEGARLVYREVAGIPAVTISASGTVSVIPALTREVVLQLPLRAAPLATKTCIHTDVVGIATDGSLIRNNEQALYRVFGAETLVGYALDGFPIYGVSAAETDECGGSTASGEYRYYLNAEREGVLGCFGGVPVTI